MRINTNMAALNAWRSMSTNAGNVQKSLEKLSSGYRINRAADDAAGLAVSEKMRAQIRGTNMAVRNAQDGISLVQTAEGALTETHNILQRMRELSVQASTGTLNDDDVKAIQEEITSLTTEVDRIAKSTKFNDKNLLSGGIGTTLGAATALGTGVVSAQVGGAKAGTYTVTAAAGTNSGLKYTINDGNGNTQTVDDVTVPAAGQVSSVRFDNFGLSLEIDENVVAGATTVEVTGSALTIQVSANKDLTNGTIGISIGDMTAAGLKMNNINVTTQKGAQDAIDTLDAAIKSVSTQRASLGATQNRLEHTVANLQVTSENLSAAESRIRDVDMASEMANFTKHNILSQASQAMMAQANQSTQGVLSLLR